MRKLLLVSAMGLILASVVGAQSTTYATKPDIPYYPEAKAAKDPYIAERCVLDLYYPEGEKEFPTVVWFHGGGLRGGNKSVPLELKEKGIAVAAVNYRLFPRVKAPAYIEDAAAATAWVMQHIGEFGGNPELVFVSGHSAGGYLCSMIGLDKHYLAAFGADADQLAGLIPFSGHTITHFTVREERGIDGTVPIVDELAPLYHVRKDAPPLLLITGDREMEMLGRYEENAYLMRMMKVVGHPETRLYEMDGYGHNMTAPAFPLLVKEVKRLSGMLPANPWSQGPPK